MYFFYGMRDAKKSSVKLNNSISIEEQTIINLEKTREKWKPEQFTGFVRTILLNIHNL